MPNITSNAYQIDKVDGPVLASSRIVGMGGAATALATDVSGVSWNPAAFGSRPVWEIDWFEIDPMVSVSAPGVFGNHDLFNSGRDLPVDQASFATLGARMQFGRLGTGFTFRAHGYTATSGEEAVRFELQEGHLGAAYAFVDGQIVAGAGLRLAGLDVTLVSGVDEGLVTLSGASPELGVLWKPNGQPFRLGLSYHAPVYSRETEAAGVEEADGLRLVRGYVLPEHVHMPWSVRLGLAWQLGPRVLNRPWRPAPDPEDVARLELAEARCRRLRAQVAREGGAWGDVDGGPLCVPPHEEPSDGDWWRAEMLRRQAEDARLNARTRDLEEAIERQRAGEIRRLSRRYWLLAADLVLIGPTADGVAVDGFLEQKAIRAGRQLSLGLNLGVETEPWPGRLKARAGFYLEPSRVEHRAPRAHGTAGLELYLFKWDLFGWLDEFGVCASLTGDAAPRYVDIGVGVGFWH